MVPGPKARVQAVLLTLAVAVAFGELSSTESFRDLEERLSRSSVPTDHRTRNRFRSLLRRSGSLEVQPPSSLAERATADSAGRCPDPELGTAAVQRAEMPSSFLAPPEFLAPGRSGLSLYLEPCRLERLNQNRMRRGRDWEEPGWISFYEDGRLRFASAVGVRIHGRSRRRWSTPSFRLYFRGALGARAFPAELLGDGSEVSPRRLALKWDLGADVDGAPWPFANAMAFEIGRRLGAEVPASRAVRVSVNGDVPTLYSLAERIDSKYFENHYGHPDFDFVRPKRDVGDSGGHFLRDELEWITSRPPPLTAAVAEGRFDLDRLAASLLTHALSATEDAFQETMFRDRRGDVAGGRWSWVLWDLDRSFHEFPSRRRRPANTRLLAKLRGGDAGRFLPEILAGRLLREDPVWRREVAERLIDALNFSLTPEFFADLIARYRELAVELAVEDHRFLDRMESYLATHPQELRTQLDESFGVGRFVAVDLVVEEGEVEIDGHRVGRSRALHYPVGRRLRFEVPATVARGFLGWRVDDEELLRSGAVLEVELSQSLRIEAVFDAAAS